MRQEAEMPNPLEPAWQDVEHETAEKFHGFQRHRAEPVASLLVFHRS
jgi:hypothetical protein